MADDKKGAPAPKIETKTSLRYIGPKYKRGIHLPGMKIQDPASWSQTKIKKMIANNELWEKYFAAEK